MFSSDFSDEELRALLGHVHVPALLVFSTLDQYYPKGARCSPILDCCAGDDHLSPTNDFDSGTNVEGLAARLTAAFPRGKRLMLADNHFLDAHSDAFVTGVANFLEEHDLMPR